MPVNMEDVRRLGWERPDIVFVTGDAYVDHPTFGCAILTRVLERVGYKVAVLAQPDWRSDDDIKRFGKPKLGFMVSAGVVDSMVNHYTASKRPRSNDVYSPGGVAGKRPDRATIVYCNMIRRVYGGVPIVIGGLEASLRRFAHYDYWDDKVRASILKDSGANLLLYGMGEVSVVKAAEWLDGGMSDELLMNMRGACFMRSTLPNGYDEIPSFEDVRRDKRAYAQAFMRQMDETDPITAKKLAQKHGGSWVLMNEPPLPLKRNELDAVYALPYTRQWHPDYDALGGVPALEEVKFSISSTRGCFGDCSFCALTYHQGRQVTSRSPASIINEAKSLTYFPDFKGYIHDVGGPTANFRFAACDKQLTHGVCKNKRCMFPKPCRNLKVSHAELLHILREIRAIKGVKKVFVRSGLRYDYIMCEGNDDFMRELAEHHISGQLKVAPEHVDPKTLSLMGKPSVEVFDAFRKRYAAVNTSLGKKQYIVPYFMSSHPGCDLNAAIYLAEYLRDTGLSPEQVQDFYPTPGTLSTCMYHTGLDPRTMKEIYVPKHPRDKAMQRALLQYRRKENQPLVVEALRKAGRDDLISYTPYNGRNGHCLVFMNRGLKGKRR